MIFHFDELPLVIEKGIEAGFVNGEAELEYECDGEWVVINITLEGASRPGPSGKRIYPQVDAPPVIAAIIEARLEKEWTYRVSEAVHEQIEEDRLAEIDNQADYRRDERMGL